MFVRVFLRLLLLFCSGHLAFSQNIQMKGNNGGVFSLGARSVISAFNDGKWSDVGAGAGGQFMIQFSNRVNTAWFMDYITGTVGNKANRQDVHIGWSVMYYLISNPPENKNRLTPYILAGHCFDYTKMSDNSNHNNFADKKSSAVQAGLGTHVHLTQRFDIMIQSQYMIHLGNDLTMNIVNNQVVFVHNPGVNLEGHILTSLVLNFKIADLW